MQDFCILSVVVSQEKSQWESVSGHLGGSFIFKKVYDSLKRCTMVKKIHLQVAPTATLLQMKKKIHEKKGIPVHEMELTYNNHQLTQEDQSLVQCGISNGSTVVLKTYSRTGDCPCEECKRMEQKVTLTVTGLQTSFHVECKLGQPVEALKKAIRDKEKIAVAKQKLSYNEVELEDHKLLSTYLVKDEEEAGAEPVIHMFVDNGDPTILDKLRSSFSFRGGKSAPVAADT